LTTKDAADMWIHESFANYAEGIYEECRSGKEAGAEYMIGSRRNIQNDAPIVGHFGVNDEGSGDMYYKGGNMLHTIRQIIDDDEKWRGILRGLNATFYHQTVTGKQVEDYISQRSGVDLSKVFRQYLTTTRIPVLEYRITGDSLSYRWTDVVSGFAMPVKVWFSESDSTVLRPTQAWQSMPLPSGAGSELRVDENYYVFSKDASVS
jgi:aminopeptidase N